MRYSQSIHVRQTVSVWQTRVYLAPKAHTRKKKRTVIDEEKMLASFFFLFIVTSIIDVKFTISTHGI